MRGSSFGSLVLVPWFRRTRPGFCFLVFVSTDSVNLVIHITKLTESK